MRKPELLILATMPPPIGGVTIHVKRLTQFLDNNDYAYTFTDLKRTTPGATVKAIWKHRFIHCHLSNSLVRCALVTAGAVLGKKIVFTFHGNIGRYNMVKNLADKWSFRLAYLPIVMNQKSMDIGSRLNKHTKFIPAFIPPGNEEPLPAELKAEIVERQKTASIICATNAYGVTIDKEGREVYQLSLLVKIFNDLPEACLIISDPSGNYKKYFERTGCSLSPNILLIDKQHSFFEILKMSDVFLRITTTDGDSLSVKEALFLQKQVLTTDVVDRPAGVQLVPLNDAAITQAIRNLKKGTNEDNRIQLKNGAAELLDLYKEVVN